MSSRLRAINDETDLKHMRRIAAPKKKPKDSQAIDMMTDVDFIV